MQFERVLKGGTVIDGTGSPGFRSDVGLQGGRIAAVGSNLSGIEEIDCTGLVVAPGFIDTHSHSDLMSLWEPTLPMKARQGITMEILGQDGISVAPLKVEDRPQVRRQLAGLDGDPPIEWDWVSVADYFSALDRARPALEMAYLVPHGALRQWVVGAEDRRATQAELAQMCELLEQGFKEGAVGLSTGLIYPPCCYGDTSELIALCRVSARYDRPFVIHIRSESDRLLEALAEVLEVGRITGVQIHLSHFKIAGRQNWGKLGQVLETLEAARASGVRVTADQYPYLAGSTMMGAILPPWAHNGGVEATVLRLGQAADRKRLRAELLDPADCDWDNFWKWSGPEGIIVADIPSGRNADLVGKNLAEAGRLRGQDPLDLAFDLLRDERMAVAMISFSQTEDVIESFMRLPYANFCTDGLLGGKPHPRAYGAFPRVLGRYVRERQVLSLEEAIRKMTSQAAQAFGLEGYGVVRAGAWANLVAFDPALILDQATFENSQQYPVGMRHVLVRGAFIVRDDALTGERPGGSYRHGTPQPTLALS